MSLMTVLMFEDFADGVYDYDGTRGEGVNTIIEPDDTAYPWKGSQNCKVRWIAGVASPIDVNIWKEVTGNATVG